jgi:Domain of unknown function (DUF4332)
MTADSDSELFNQPVSVVEGIGDFYSDQLDAVGIHTLQDLLSIDPETVHQNNEDLPLTLLEKSKAMAWLMLVDNVTPDIAECLVDAEINSVNELADKSLRTLCAALTEGEAKNKINNPPDYFKLSNIQKDAEKISSTGIIIGRCNTKQDRKLLTDGGSILVTQNAKYIDRITLRNDGSFLISGLKTGQYTLTMEIEGYFPHSFEFYVKSGCVSGAYTLSLCESIKQKSRPTLKEIDGAQIQITARTKVKQRKIELNDLPDKTYLTIQNFYKNGDAKLVHHFRTRQGNTVYIDYVRLPEDQLPKDSQVSTLLHYKEGELGLSEHSLSDVMIEHFCTTFGPVKFNYQRTITPANRVGKPI